MHLHDKYLTLVLCNLFLHHFLLYINGIHFLMEQLQNNIIEMYMYSIKIQSNSIFRANRVINIGFEILSVIQHVLLKMHGVHKNHA